MVEMSLTRGATWFYHEFGVSSVCQSGKDTWLIILGRTSRMFAYGSTALILALFFAELDFPDYKIGLFLTLTLFGDVLLSLFLTVVADGLGRRRVLFAGAVMMALSGAIFAIFENFWILLIAAVVGVISATGSEIGPFRAIEESTLSHLTSPKTRADVLSWYVTAGSLGSAIGTELTGRVIDGLLKLEGWSYRHAYHAIFWLYTATGLFNMVLALLLTEKCEAEKPSDQTDVREGLLQEDHSDTEDSPETVTRSSVGKRLTQKACPTGFFASISSETRAVMYKLWFLLAIDSLADGMVSYSLTSYFMDQKFHLLKSTLGHITSISYFLSASSTIFASPLARRLGLINTMVFTHLPSSAAVLLFPAPSSLILTVILFFIRTGLNNMDQAPRAAFIAAVVRPEERTAVMGITTMLRQMTSTVGPSVTGLLAGSGRFWIAFVAAGFLRICYDLGLFVMFVNMKLHSHEKGDEQVDTHGSNDEEQMLEMQETHFADRTSHDATAADSGEAIKH